MPKTVKTTPEKEKNIFQRAFDRLPEGFKNFIRTIRDIAVSLTNRVIFGNRQAERLRKADVDEILRKEKEERENGSDDKDTPKDKLKEDKDDKDEIKKSPETQEWLAGFAGVTDIKELSERLTEAGVPHRLVESEGQPSHIICQNPTTEQIAQIGLISAQMNEEGRFVSQRTGEVIDDVAIWGESNEGLLEFTVLNKDASQLETRYVSSAVAFEVLNVAYENSKEKSVETQELDNSPIVFANKANIESLHQELSDANVPHELKDIDTDSPYISYLDKDGSELAQIRLVSQEIQLNKSEIIYTEEKNGEVVAVISGGDTLYASIPAVSEELVATQQRQEFEKEFFERINSYFSKGTEEDIQEEAPTEETVVPENSENKNIPTEEDKKAVEEEFSSAQHDNVYTQAEAEASAQVNTIIVYNAQAYNKALDNAKRTGQDLDIKLADTAFTVEVREGKVQGKEVQFKSKNEKSEKQFRDVVRSKSHTFIEGKENSIALAHGELQIDMKRDANKAFVEISKGDRVKTLTLTSNESPEQLYEQIQGAIKDLDKAIDLDEPEEFAPEETASSAKKTLEEMIEDAGEQANGHNDYEYVIPDETNLDDGFYDPRYS